MLKAHDFYIYHDENRVYARRGQDAPVLAQTCADPQAAADFVQSVLNPDDLRYDHKSLGGLGFGHRSFQERISPRCQEFVEAAYAAADA